MAKGDLTTEKQLQEQVKALAKLFGYKYYHTWRAIHSPAGFPDCVLVKEERVIFAELKSSKGKVTEQQQEWIDALAKAPGVEVYLWRPEDFEEIVSILRRD